MAWLLLTVTAVLAVLVLVLALQVRRLGARVAALSPSSDGSALPGPLPHHAQPSLDEEPAARAPKRRTWRASTRTSTARTAVTITSTQAMGKEPIVRE